MANKKVKSSNNMVSKSTYILSLVVASLISLFIGNLSAHISFYGDPPSQKEFSNSGSFGSSAANSNLLKIIAEQEDILRSNPNNHAAWAKIGDCYFDLGNPEEAIKAYEKSISINPKNPNVLVDCGIMYRSTGNFEKALTYFLMAQKIDPSHQQSYFNAGVVLYNDLNRKNEAKEIWQQLLKINPNAKTPDNVPIAKIIETI